MTDWRLGKGEPLLPSSEPRPPPPHPASCSVLPTALSPKADSGSQASSSTGWRSLLCPHPASGSSYQVRFPKCPLCSAGWLSWLEHRPYTLSSQIRSQSGAYGRQPTDVSLSHRCFSLSLSFSPFLSLSLKINEHPQVKIKKKVPPHSSQVWALAWGQPLPISGRLTS